MALLTSQLMLKATLFIAPTHPAFLRHPRADVWFSDPKAVVVKPLNDGILISARNESGGLQSLGLDGADPAHLVRVQNVSDETYDALKKCPQAPVEVSDTGLTLFLRGKSLPATLSELSKCGFTGLRLGSQDIEDAALQEILALKESEALAQGHRILASRWEEGHRVLTLDETQAKHSVSLKNLFAGLWPVIEIRAGKGPRPGNTLIFEVTLFEFFRNAASKIGASWPDSFRILNLEGNPFRKINPALSLGLDFGESQGVAKVLARPQLRVKAGQHARFQSGGELPVQVITETVQTTQWKAYGLLLDLGVPEETRTGADELSVDFKVELSEPDLSRGTQTLPGLTVRRLESRFDLRAQETTVLSTMIQSRSGALRSGVAGLSETPILKHVFSTKSAQEEESELWFAIRPRWDELPWNEDRIQNANDHIRKL